MDKNFLGNEIKWVWTMRKLNNPLSVSFYPEGTARGKKEWGSPQTLSATWYDNGDIYFDEEEISTIRQFLRAKIAEQPKYPVVMAKRVFTLVESIRRKRIAERGLKHMTLVALLKRLEHEQQLFLQILAFMSYRGAIQMSEILEEQLTDILTAHLADLPKYVALFNTPFHQSVVAEEKEHVLQQAKGFSTLNATAQAKRVQGYLTRYRWLSYHWFVGTPPTVQEVHARFLQLAPTAYAELKKLRQANAATERSIQSTMRQFKFSKRERELVVQHRTWVFLRTFVKDHINLAAYQLLPILYEIAKRVGLHPEDMPFLTIEEIRHIAKFPLVELQRRIAERQQAFSAGMIDGRFRTGGFTKPQQESVHQEENQIRGSPAYIGTVRGIVRVLHSPREQHKLNPGEILVTGMTTPDFLPSMERAAAFVTDEGGITCHAAIVSREMKKPCVVGTRNATQMLHNGDMVEVDAAKGTVTILKRA